MRRILVVPLLLFAGACASGPTVPVIEKVAWPTWAERPDGHVDGTTFQATGASPKIKNVSLARSAADNRARAGISRVMEAFTASLLKDYAQQVYTEHDYVAEEQPVGGVIKTVHANLLSSVSIAGHWAGPDGTLYARARLDVAKWRDEMLDARHLSEAIRKGFERAFGNAMSDVRSKAPPPPSKPAWVDQVAGYVRGKDGNQAAVLYATGIGATTETARDAARAAVLRMLRALVPGFKDGCVDEARKVWLVEAERWEGAGQHAVYVAADLTRLSAEQRMGAVCLRK